MTISGFGGSACREMRQLLGVYVVGAIDPAERALVDEHLSQCALCRDELAGLAGLPAMLSRVPASDVQRLSMSPTGLPELAEPPAELLNSLLRRVAVRRRARMWRGAVAVAAAAVIAAAGATAITQLTRPATAQREVATGINPSTHVGALVDYSATGWGTAMRVQVSGISPGTKCQFWVVGAHGRKWAGTWTVTGYGQRTWYSASAPVPASSVRGFQITSDGHDLLNISAS
jgi:Putative zinc-finger